MFQLIFSLHILAYCISDCKMESNIKYRHMLKEIHINTCSTCSTIEYLYLFEVTPYPQFAICCLRF